jgi:Rhodopirellula transposase DDE domain
VRVLAAKFAAIVPHLDERQRRLLMGAEARALGHGGIRLVAGPPGSARPRCRWESMSWTPGRSRWAGRGGRGGGRKQAADLDPGLRPALLALVEPDERGDPISPLRRTTKSTRNLAAELTRQGHRADVPVSLPQS